MVEEAGMLCDVFTTQLTACMADWLATFCVELEDMTFRLVGSTRGQAGRECRSDCALCPRNRFSLAAPVVGTRAVYSAVKLKVLKIECFMQCLLILMCIVFVHVTGNADNVVVFITLSYNPRKRLQVQNSE